MATITGRMNNEGQPDPKESPFKELTTFNALIGIDPDADFERALKFFARIGFRGAEATLLGVVEPVNLSMPVNSVPVYDFSADVELLKIRTEFAQAALDRAEQMMKMEGIPVRKELRTGFAAQEFLAFGHEMNADLLVTSATHHGVLSSAFLGSVSRAAVIGADRSVLIAKKDLPEGKPLHAVFATDLSHYCNSALEHLAAIQPLGLRKVTVMTAYHAKSAAEEQELRLRCEHLCDTLWKQRIQAETLVMDAPPGRAIDCAMDRTGANLLIMAAQGHSFFQRLMIGSLSLHEAVAGNHSLLILRPPA